MSTDTRTRRIGGWGFEGEEFPPSEKLLDWLEQQIGTPLHPLTAATVTAPSTPLRPLPELPEKPSLEALDRLRHARGQGLVDIIRIRSGSLPALPDGVCRPRHTKELEALLRAASAAGVRVIPWGGGTSVTGGVNVPADGPPTLSLDLERLSGLRQVDQVSRLAAFGPGTAGPAVEKALAEHGLTLGHFPQSWELATVGGWVVTRSSGQESLGFGRIEDMVAGLELVAPAGRLTLPELPASAAGPDLRHLVMGSEGRLGIVSEVSLRVRPRPRHKAVQAALVPDIARGLQAARALVWSEIPLNMLRLSDACETQVAMAVGLASSSAAPLVRAYLRLRGMASESCLMLVGAAGERDRVSSSLREARGLLRQHGAVSLGQGPGRHWLRDRFRHPYLRESLLDLGIATDTLETAVPWSRAAAARELMIEGLSTALEEENERVAVLCHVSHPYRDGASLYFTFFFRLAADPDHSIARWARLKRAANRILVEQKATLSHHHGVGQWHAPWLEHEIGERGHALLTAAAREMDPDGILNPRVLLDGADHLEE